MNIIDVLLLVVVMLAIYTGYLRGFISGTLNLLLVVLGLAFAFWSYRHTASFAAGHIPSLGVWTAPLSFLLTYLFARIVLGAILRRLVAALPPKAAESNINKVLGVLPGLINGIIQAAVISAILLSLPLFDGLSEKTRESPIANAFLPKVEWAEAKFAPIFDEAINHGINKLMVPPSSEKTLELNFSVTDAKVRPELEAKMLDLINEERQAVGLPLLFADPAMQEVARAHSRDMFVKGYFSHVNKEGLTPAERARKFGVRFITAGENLALAPTLTSAHDGLMNSPGHKANILRPSFGRVGIGILDGGRHGLMVTQNFRN